MHKVINSFRLLKEYCENEGFKGWDPYDGLNSKVFRRCRSWRSRQSAAWLLSKDLSAAQSISAGLRLFPRNIMPRASGFSFPVTATYIMRLRQTPNLRKASALPIPWNHGLTNWLNCWSLYNQKVTAVLAGDITLTGRLADFSFSQSLLQPLLRAISVQPPLWKHTKLPERKGILKSLSVRQISLSTTFTARNIRTDSYSLTARCRETTLSLTPHCSAQGCLVLLQVHRQRGIPQTCRAKHKGMLLRSKAKRCMGIWHATRSELGWQFSYRL